MSGLGLSVAGLLILFYYFIVGISIVIVPPPWLFAFADQSDSDVGKPATRFALNIEILNTSRSNATAVLRDIILEVSASGKKYPYHMNEFQNIETFRSLNGRKDSEAWLNSPEKNANGKGVAAILKDGSRLFNCAQGAIGEGIQDAFQLGPEQNKELGIAAGSTLSGTLSLAPNIHDPRLPWSDFLKIVATEKGDATLRIILLDGTEFLYQCQIIFDQPDRSFAEQANFRRIDGIDCRPRSTRWREIFRSFRADS
jgi:hypothetical protein